MIPADRTEFVKVVVGLASQKPGKTLTAEGLELFWQSMQHWPIDEFKAAALQLNRTVEFMPNAFHFEQLRKAAGPTAAEQWTRVMELVPMNRWRREAALEAEPLTVAAQRAVVAMGGWYGLEMADTATRHFREKRFAELFEELGTADEARAALPVAGRLLGGPQSAGLLLGRRA